MFKPLPTLAAGLLVVTLLTGCNDESSESASAPPAADGAVSTQLANYGLEGADSRTVIDKLDRTNQDRADGFQGSVRQDQLVLVAGSEQQSLPMPADQTYVSIAPFQAQTHECFNHSLNSCQGEQVDKEFQVKITDSTGKTLVDQSDRTYDNGFVGYWLPRDITGTITISGEGKTGSVPFGTGPNDPTCLTTLQLR